MEEIDLSNADLYDLPPINGERFGMLISGLGLIALSDSSSDSATIAHVRIENSASNTIPNTDS